MLVYNKLKVNNKDFRNFYKKQTKKDSKNRLHEYDNDKIIRLFLKKVSKYIVEKPSGVHIKNIGYFHVFMIPYERVSRFNGQILPRYKLTYTPTDNSYFKYWSMDYQFREKVQNKLTLMISKGYKYYNMVDAVSDIDSYRIGKNRIK